MKHRSQWTSLAAFISILLISGAADGLMDVLGPIGFILIGVTVMGAAWALVEYKEAVE